LIALTGDYRLARAAFDEAVKRGPVRIVTLARREILSNPNYRSERSGRGNAHRRICERGKSDD
jgi:hypothetical protein